MMGDRWKEMSRRVQGRDENVREYYHEKVFLCRQIGMKFYESKIQILKGLYSKELSMYLLGRNHADEDDLLSDMVEYERLDMSRSVRIRQLSSTKENTLQKSVTSCPTNVVAVKQEDMKVTVERKSASLPRSCFNCGAKTHLSPQCPNLNARRERVTNADRWRTNDDPVQHSCEGMMTGKRKSQLV